MKTVLVLCVAILIGNSGLAWAGDPVVVCSDESRTTTLQIVPQIDSLTAEFSSPSISFVHLPVNVTPAQFIGAPNEKPMTFTSEDGKSLDLQIFVMNVPSSGLPIERVGVLRSTANEQSFVDVLLCKVHYIFQ